MSEHVLIQRLADALAEVSAAAADPPETARRGAVLVLLTPGRDLDAATIMYTRRQAGLSSHPGQISFPGGRVDPGEGIVEAALREAAEEVALDPSSVRVLGRLPAFYIPPSRFWMAAVVATWEAPHPLVPAEAEVAEILSLPLGMLKTSERLRSVPLSSQGASWAWVLDSGDLLWGATAVVTGILMDVMVPGWAPWASPDDLPDDRVLRPWEGQAEAAVGPARMRPRLRDTRTTVVSAPASTSQSRGRQASASSSPAQQRLWANGVAESARRLHRRPQGPVVVLAGTGTVGRIGRLAAEMLADGGDEVVVVDPADSLGSLQEATASAGVIIDALVGRGLRGALADPFLAVARALRRAGAPIIAVDLPSGIHPVQGLIGETVSADVTVTGPELVPGHVASGALPFVADLYVVDEDGELRRAEVGRPQTWAE